ncbi:MAG TPA: hypothetical protein DCZ01_12180 [Elusimicrobia bacterium]|nr:MAG: hypothetical protein A2X37_02315 [Elusimicrobia bacterium GWA2_66_18]OGR70855.1 MAG: hypothetical protein A2X40_05945 [Elusimicrobia bacterium GWC2_65_9]HAZ09248.1 hypothetical protein [Elusimicrobiota bacterium]
MERSIHVHLTFAYEPRSLRPWLTAFMLMLAAGDLASENMTLTTYYPAPSGVYTQMVTTGQTLLARDSPVGLTPGRVGIGLGPGGVPAYRLDVVGDANANPAWATRVRSQDLSATALLGRSGYGADIDIGTNGNSGTYGLNVHRLAGAVDTPHLYVRGDGNVGVGTAMPTEKLDVTGNSNGAPVMVHVQNSGTQGVALGLDSDARNWSVRSAGSGNANPGYFVIRDLTSNANRLAITPSGDVGIGMNSPQAKLDVNGTARVSGFSMPTGAASNRVLTSDAAGNASWQNPPDHFGGMYNYNTGNNCVTGNVFTGTCSCPSGYSASLLVTIQVSGNNNNHRLYYCYKL